MSASFTHLCYQVFLLLQKIFKVSPTLVDGSVKANC